MTTSLPALQEWVDSVAQLTQPETIHWCTGSDDENQRLIAEMNESGVLIPLNEDKYPNCYLHRSDPSDVARVEHLTFVCTDNEDDAGPNNHWMSPGDAHAKIDALFAGAMQGRTMYVIPYCMGPIDSPYSRLGVEITDSPYVVVNMKLMTRMGIAARERIERVFAVPGNPSSSRLPLQSNPRIRLSTTCSWPTTDRETRPSSC